MKYIIIFFLMLSIALISCGYFIDTTHNHKLIGFGVVTLFLVVFPLFSYYRWKGKNVSDYMLTKENLDKMREHKNRKKN